MKIKKKLKKNIEKQTDATNAKWAVWNEFRTFYINHPAYEFCKLSNLLEEKKKYTSEIGLKLLNELQKRYFKPNLTSDIASYLAFDRMFSFQYPDEMKEKIAYSHMADLYSYISSKIVYNASVSKGLFEAFAVMPVIMKKRFLRLNRGEPLNDDQKNELRKMNDAIKQANETFRYRQVDDLLDSELSHFGAFGQNTGRRALKPAVILTCDSNEVLKRRVALNRSCLLFLDSLYKKELGIIQRIKFFLQKKNPRPGFVFQVCPDTGVFKNRFDASSVSDLVFNFKGSEKVEDIHVT